MVLVYFMRHAKSMANEGTDMKDAPLSETGRIQASKLTGDYDIVIISNLRRTRETLEYSHITYESVIETPYTRELMNGGLANYLEGEDPNLHETYEMLQCRADKLKRLIHYLEDVKGAKKILVISHGSFLSFLLSWRADIPNATVLTSVVF
jgi:broad specificity phosphatase PhoE